MRLRPEVEADRPFLRELHDTVRRHEFEPLGWDDDRIDELLSLQFEVRQTQLETEFPHAERSVVTLDGHDVGRWCVDRTETELHLLDVAFVPDARDRGLGTALLERLIDESRATNRPVRLWVDPTNRALRLYERLGFRRVGEHGPSLQLERRAR